MSQLLVQKRSNCCKNEYKFLASLSFCLRILQRTTHLEFETEKNQAVITDIKDVVKELLDHLEELESLDVDLLCEAEERW